MKQEIALTPEGGNYYRAIACHWATTILVLPLVVTVTLLAILNPLWFRNDFFNYVERKVNQFCAWRNLIKYRIYLGTDPAVWHALKD
jgi:hypothetical protein